ncbi:MAG: hypothetical protein KAT35_02150, partial [Candidatus Aenigmarchaeota archaeon]|nr:hypothetical protein [Candidatus Aenigmarchaeota archaeon]
TFEPLNRYPFFPFFDAQIAVNQGMGPALLTFGLVGAYLLLRQPLGTRRRFEERFSLAWLVLLFILLELFLLKLDARVTLLLVPVASLFAAYGFTHLAADSKAHVRTLSVLLLIAIILPSLVIGIVGFKSARISYETNTLVFNVYVPPPSHEKFMRDSYGIILDGVDYLNTQTPPDAKVLANLPLTYLINRSLYSTGGSYGGSFDGFREIRDLEASVEYLKGKDISYVFIAQHDVSHIPCADNPIQNNLDDERFFEPLYENQKVRIFRIN